MTRSADVLVIGAGVAGLSAAGKLSEAGLDVLVLEGRDRVGGRIWTVLNDYCHPIELGAEFIHGKQQGLFDILNRSKLRLIDVSNHHHLIVNGQMIGPQDYFDKLEEILEDMNQRARVEEMTFAEFESRLYASKPHLKDVMQMVHSYIEDYNSADANLVSIQWLASAGEAEDRNDARAMFRLSGGYSTLVETLLSGAGKDSVLTRHTVKRVVWHGNAVEIEAEHNGAIERFQGRGAIVTLPLSVLQSGPSLQSYVEFDPPLPEGKNCDGRLVMGGALRMNFQFKSRFWEDLSLDGKDDLNNLAFIHEPEVDFQTWWSQLPVRTPLLVGWFAGGAARKLIGKPEDELKERALDSLAGILKTTRKTIDDQLEKVYFHDWNNDPYSMGSYSYAVCGSADAALKLAKPVAGKLFFAGEATNSEGEAGTVHGAIQTGLRAADEYLTTHSQ